MEALWKLYKSFIKKLHVYMLWKEVVDFNALHSIKSILIHEYQHKSTRVNTNQHESDTSQHESTRVWHELIRPRNHHGLS